MNIARWLDQAARTWPERPALAIGDQAVATYREFAATATRLGASLRTHHGVGAGDRVLLYLPNSVRYLEALFAVWWNGAVVVPVNYKLHPVEVQHIVIDVEPVLIMAPPKDCARLQSVMPTANFLEVGAEAWDLGEVEPQGSDEGRHKCSRSEPVDREPEDCAWIFYSSGTTGTPKGVMLSNDNLVSMSLTYLADVDDIGSGETSLYAAPLSHGAGLYCLVHVLRGSVHVVPASGRFDEEEVLDLAESWGSTSMFAAPTMVRRLLTAARGRSEPGRGLKTVIYGGGPMYLSDIQEAMHLMGNRFVQIYGQAESPMTVTVLDRATHQSAHRAADGHVLASVGRAASSVSVRMTAPGGDVAGPGEVGEVEVRGPTTMLGYWGNPAATRATLRDGWLRTGDLGYLDDAGWLTLVGRSKEVVISGGTNIYPREVEDVLVAHPGVDQVAVVGAPDAEWGEILVAFVVNAPGAEVTAADLDRHCLKYVARFKRPRLYEFVADLPKNNNGKVVKTQLLQRLASAWASPTTEHAPSTSEEVRHD